MPLGFPAEAFESALRYEARAGDIFVCTYPKCGTTWMQYIVYLLCHGAEPLGPDRSLGDVFPHLEEVGREVVEALPDPRLIKTHLPRTLAPYARAALYSCRAQSVRLCRIVLSPHARLPAALRIRGRYVRGFLRVFHSR